MEHPRVFISYSHDSRPHADAVLALSNCLRLDGFDCRIDQYEVDPPEGWTAWMERHTREADYILVICTPTYLARLEGREALGKGLGARFESMLFMNDIARGGALNPRCIPVLFSQADQECIPRMLGGNRYFIDARGKTGKRLRADGNYRSLLKRLDKQPGADMPPLGPARGPDRTTPLKAPTVRKAMPVLEQQPQFFTSPTNAPPVAPQADGSIPPADEAPEIDAGEGAYGASSNDPDEGGGIAVAAPPTHKFELLLDRPFDEYTPENEAELNRAINSLLRLTDELILRNRRRGSVVFTVELTDEQAELIQQEIALGTLDRFGVKGLTRLVSQGRPARADPERVDDEQQSQSTPFELIFDAIRNELGHEPGSRITPAQLARVTTLRFHARQFTDAVAMKLAEPDTGLKNLTTLDLWNTRMTDAGVAALARADTGLKSLTTLNLSFSQVTDAGVADLARAESGLKSLTTLNLWNTQVTDVGVAALARPDSGLKNLTTLDLRDTQVTDAGVAALARADSSLKSLTTLSLGFTQVTDAGVAALTRADTGLKSLTTLDLRGTWVSDAGAAAMARADSGLKSLTALYLGDTLVTGATKAAIRKNLPKCTVY